MRFTFATSLALLVHPLLTISLASPTPVNGLAITGDLPVAFVATALPSGKPGSLEYKALKAHNDFRALHGAKALVWSTKLAAGAKMLVLFPKNGPWGENLSATAGCKSTITDGIKFWSDDEASEYDPINPTYSHFTQEVWKSSTRLGCAQTTCPAGPPGPFAVGAGPWTFYVCEYNPPGNIDTKAEYLANVQP